MVFDWLAMHWIGLFVFSAVWLVLWVFIFLLAGALEKEWLLVIAMPMLWLSNVPFWAAVIGLVCALVTHFTGG